MPYIYITQSIINHYVTYKKYPISPKKYIFKNDFFESIDVIFFRGRDILFNFEYMYSKKAL